MALARWLLERVSAPVHLVADVLERAGLVAVVEVGGVARLDFARIPRVDDVGELLLVDRRVRAVERGPAHVLIAGVLEYAADHPGRVALAPGRAWYERAAARGNVGAEVAAAAAV